MKNIVISILFVATLSALFSCRKDAQLGSACNPPNVCDIDGNVYTTITIGTQCWMQQNLKTTHYQNGAAITEIEDSAHWANIDSNHTTPAWCYFGGDSASNVIYGKLYNFYAVNNPANICPDGWHVPSDSDVTVLINYLGGEYLAGGALKSTSNLWLTPNTGATNSSGFSALPAGDRGSYGGFRDFGNYTAFWCSTPDSSTNGTYWFLYYYDGDAFRGNNLPDGFGFSVRCIKNN